MVMRPSAPAAEPATAGLAEYKAWSVRGTGVMVAAQVALWIGIALLITAFTTSGAGSGTAAIWGTILLVVAATVLPGMVPVVTGEARVVQLFGRYQGTVREPGLAFVYPAAKRRLRSYQTPVLKVNDADGNPVEIAAVVIWQVADTAKALYAVDDVSGFVTAQAETAIRDTAACYPYTSHAGGPSLHGDPGLIAAELAARLAGRVAPSGVEVTEARLTRLAYAPEIAEAMLRQQQATAVVAARQKIVEGAVGMVQLALERLKEEGVVDLDEERKAAMVSNLLVVLCSEQSTQQVVNTGSLYQ
jgi:hypothetical protein